MGNQQLEQMGGPKCQRGRRKRVAKAVSFSCLESAGSGPGNEEIPENEVNLAIRFINLANALGAGNRGRKNWAAECSSVTDTGYKGGGWRSYSRLGSYAEYVGSFRPMENC